MIYDELDKLVDTVLKLEALWASVRARCSSPSSPTYRDYGAKGITLDKEWCGRAGRSKFIKWALKNGWVQPQIGERVKVDLDRRDNKKGYGPGNCRFISHKENCRNKSNNVMLTLNDETKCIASWGDDKRCVVPAAQFQQRINCGWSLERALTQPLRKRGKHAAAKT